MVILYALVTKSRMRTILSLGLVRLLTHRAGDTAGSPAWPSLAAPGVLQARATNS